MCTILVLLFVLINSTWCVLGKMFCKHYVLFVEACFNLFACNMACRDGSLCLKQYYSIVGGHNWHRIGEVILWEHFCVLVICARSARWIFISVRQFGLWYMLIILVGPWCSRKFVWHEKFDGQGRYMSANVAWVTNVEIWKCCSDMPSPSTFVYFSRPAGGRSLRASVPLW